MVDVAVANTIDEAKEVLDALHRGEVVQYRPLGRGYVWRDRLPGRDVPDFHSSQYRVKPSAVWIIVHKGQRDVTNFWYGDNIDSAIHLAAHANTGIRKLLYVVKVEGDVATIQKTPS